MIKNLRVKIKNQSIQLFPQRVMYWEEEKILIINNLIKGKSSINKSGVLTQAPIEVNLEKITHLIKNMEVERIIFTGELFHGKNNGDWKIFCSWRKENRSIKMDIITAKHDPIYSAEYSRNLISVYDTDLVIPPFIFSSHAKEDISFDKYYITGDRQPVFSVQGMGNDNVRLPCFYFGKTHAFIPNFVNLNGGFEIKRKIGDHVYLIMDNSVVEVS